MNAHHNETRIEVVDDLARLAGEWADLTAEVAYPNAFLSWALPRRRSPARVTRASGGRVDAVPDAGLAGTVFPLPGVRSDRAQRA